LYTNLNGQNNKLNLNLHFCSIIKMNMISKLVTPRLQVHWLSVIALTILPSNKMFFIFNSALLPRFHVPCSVLAFYVFST